MQKIYLNVVLTVLILAFSFFTGTLLAQATSSVSHRAEEIKSGIFGSDLNDTGTYSFPGWVTLDGGGAKLKVGASDISSVGLTVNGSSLVVNPTTGNVGIGTTAPGAKLSVRGSIYFEGGSGDVNEDGFINVQDLLRVISYLQGSTSLPETQQANADVDGNGVVTMEDYSIIAAMIGGNLNLREKAEIATHRIAYAQGSGNLSNTTWSNRYFIVDGNVGIGTIAPGAKLDVSGDIRASGNIQTTGGTFDIPNTWDSQYKARGKRSIGGAQGWDANMLYINGFGDWTSGTKVGGPSLEVDGNIKLSGATPTYKVTNLAAPTASSDAATKGYVDAQVTAQSNDAYIVVPRLWCEQYDCQYYNAWCPDQWGVVTYWHAWDGGGSDNVECCWTWTLCQGG